MLRGECEHLESRIPAETHPRVSIEFARVPGLVCVVVLLAILERHRQERPRFTFPSKDGVNTPVNPQTEL